MKRTSVVLVLMAGLSALALPATAETPRAGVLAFAATAEACATYDGNGGPKANGANGNCATGETGLYLTAHIPGVSNGGQRSARYVLATISCIGTGVFGTPLATACALGPIDGNMGPLSGIGASCDWSNGYNGFGPGQLGSLSFVLNDFGWTAGIGGTLVAAGHYESPGLPGKKAGPWHGAVVGLLQAQGGLSCIKTPINGNGGADTLSIIGVLALL